jgi:hypothetical protein
MAHRLRIHSMTSGSHPDFKNNHDIACATTG